MAKKKAAEALARVLHSSKGVQDLPKLESAILAARKVGAEELDMGAYQAASELRSKLAEASRAKILLAEKLKGFTRGQRNADVEEAVVKAISDAEGCAPELLELEIRDAKEKLERWRAACSAEAKLAKALRDGNSAPALRRAIQDASAVGSKVRCLAFPR